MPEPGLEPATKVGSGSPEEIATIPGTSAVQFLSECSVYFAYVPIPVLQPGTEQDRFVVANAIQAGDVEGSRLPLRRFFYEDLINGEIDDAMQTAWRELQARRAVQFIGQRPLDQLGA